MDYIALMTQSHILVVDDDPQIRTLLHDYLEQHGYRVSVARDGNEMWREFKKYAIDLVVLDIMMPGEDGLSLCRKLREQSEVSIIMLSAIGDETDRVVGLEVGADDYLAKPFGPRELLARVKALMRRSSGNLSEQRQAKRIASMPNIRFNEWALDQNKRRLVSPEGVTVPLSSGEYDLLLAFLENAGRVLNRDQLLDITRGREAQPFDRTIDVQVARLRKKIEKDPKNPQMLTTVRGGGYQFDAEINREG
jgi:two-component system, OmpR family, response regulator